MLDWQKKSLWLPRDLATIYVLVTKFGPDLVSQVLQTQLTSNMITLSDMLVRQKNFINGVIMTVTWFDYSLKTRHKMRTRFNISSSTSIYFSFCLGFLFVNVFFCFHATKIFNANYQFNQYNSVRLWDVHTYLITQHFYT